MENEMPIPLQEVDVKCEIIELSDEDVTLVGGDTNNPKQLDNAQKPKRKRIKKKKDPSQYVQCDRCSKKFATNSQLKKHMLTHTGEKPYVCSECGKCYRQTHHLKTHELTHNGIVKNFTCTECGSTFTRKSSLRTHEKIHTGLKPFSCTVCTKAFVQKINLVYHMKIHQDDRQFECEACNKKFMTRSKLKQHSKRHLKNNLKLVQDATSVVTPSSEYSECSMTKQDSTSVVTPCSEYSDCSMNSEGEEMTISLSPPWAGSESDDTILS